jgi:hypothetical protein
VPRRVVPAGAKVEIHPATLPLHLVDLTFAVVLAGSLEGQQLCVPGGVAAAWSASLEPSYTQSSGMGAYSECGALVLEHAFV